MYYNQKKFAGAAQRRKYFAIALSVLLHLAAFAVISSDQSLEELMPAFIYELFDTMTESPGKEVPHP